MNIILINHYAGSQNMGMEFRPFYLAKEWIKQGHNVLIVAATYSHLRTENIDKIEKNITLEDNVPFYWIHTPIYEGNGLSRLKNTYAFSRGLVKESNNIVGYFKPDVIVASSPHPFIIFGAEKMAKLSKAKLVFEVRDLWPLSMIKLHNLSPLHPFMFLMQRVENYSYRVADGIASVLPYANQYYISHGAKGKIGYFPNSIDTDSWNDSTVELNEEIKNKVNSIKNENKFIIGYVGTIGVANCVENLVLAAQELQKKDIAFVIVGDGDQRILLENICKENSISNVHFVGKVQKSHVPSLLDMFDALYIGWKNIDLYQYGVSPNKIMDYMMAGKPIVHAISAEKDIVTEYDCGITVEAENYLKLADAIKTLSDMNPSELIRLGSNGQQAVIENHNYSNMASNYIDFLIEVGDSNK